MNLIGTRPNSLIEVSRRVLDGSDYASTMKEFLDEVVQSAQVDDREGDAVLVIPVSFIEDEPLRLPDPVDRAHIAGMAEYISQLACTPPPAWVESDDYFLPEAVYMGGTNSRSIFLAETPSSFRRRNLFCGRVGERLLRMLG
jgi:hypothetical protein